MTVFLAACCPAFGDTAADLSRAESLARKGSANEAAAAYQELVRVARAAHDRATLGAALTGLADLHLSAGRYDPAISSAIEAAQAFGGLNDRRGQGRALTIVGLAEFYKGDYDSALTHLSAALDLARASGDRDGEVVRLNNIGSIFYSRGRYSDALDRYQQAMAIIAASQGEKWVEARRQLTAANIAIVFQRLGQYQRALDTYLDLRNTVTALRPAEQAQLLANMGVLYRRLGDPIKALETYRAARAIYERAQNLDGSISALNDIGIVQALDFENLAEALKTFTESLDLADKSHNRPLSIHARLYRAETEFRLGDLSAARQDLEAALQTAQQLHSPEDTWKALFGLARVSERLGNNTDSEALLKRAVSIIESLRGDLRNSMRSEFLADKRDVYDLLIDRECSKPSPDVQLVYRTMEMARGRNLQDRAAAKGYKPDLQYAQRILPAGSVLLEYWTSANSAAVLWVSKSSAGLRQWKISGSEAAAFDALPNALAEKSTGNWLQLASALSGSLLPAEALGQGTKNLIIVPDGKLARIPFEVLPISGTPGQLVVDRFTTTYVPTAAALVRDHRATLRFPWQQTASLFADPDPLGPADPLELASDRDWSLLPAARTEANAIAAILRGRCSLHVGSDARRSYIERFGAQPPPVLHFATHAMADLQDADRSYIVLASHNPRERFDYLFLKEIGSLQLNNADMVVISACDSQKGKLLRGEGIQNFSRSFLLAGSGSVITTLWSIGDRPTAEFMRRFYSRLAAGESKASALQAAKLDFRRSTAVAHPWYWAAFVISGDASGAIPYVIPWWMVFAAPLALASLLLFVMRKRI